MRTFIALDINDESRKVCSQLQSHLKYASADVKWVKSENTHLTLKFLGEIDQNMVSKISAVLDKCAGAYKQFDISLFKCGAFPSLDFPKVIWLGIDQNCGLIEEIAERVDSGCAELGFEKEKRRFSAHLTLGRVTSPRNKEMLKEKLLTAEVPRVISPVDSIVLYQSTLTPKGSIYTAIHKAHFTDI